MKNQKGIGVLLSVLTLFVLIVTFMGSGAVYFSALYKDIGRQQRVVAGYLAMQDFSVMARRAREVYVETAGACNPGVTEKDGSAELCWPTAVGTRHCVPHPLGNTAANSRWICRSPDGTRSGETGKDGVMDVVLQTQNQPYTYAQIFIENALRIRSDFFVGLDILALKFQNLAMAQETAYLPLLTGVPTLQFSTALNCATYSTALEAWCKRCTDVATPNLNQCFRMRICLKPSGCDPADNGSWIVQEVGVINRQRTLMYDLGGTEQAVAPLGGGVAPSTGNPLAPLTSPLPSPPPPPTPPSSCSLDGVTIPHGGSRIFYQGPAGANPLPCCTDLRTTRLCSAGTLGGSSVFSSSKCRTCSSMPGREGVR